MSNLFSSFDPQSILGLSMNWASITTWLILFPPIYWSLPSHTTKAVSSAVYYVAGELKAVTSSQSVPGMLLVPTILFLSIAMSNALGLFPYVFTSTSHLSAAVSLALPLWLGHMLMGVFHTPTNMLAHLVPLGTPNMLMPFMVVIELVSSVIRPLTLSVRLAANMIAGHLLLTLLGNLGPSSAGHIIPLVLSALVCLAVLECAVAIIQAYVFSMLSTLYVEEVNSPTMP